MYIYQNVAEEKLHSIAMTGVDVSTGAGLSWKIGSAKVSPRICMDRVNV